MSEYFGHQPDDNGDINFITVYTDFEVNNYEDYQTLMDYLVQLALQKEVMPILRFGDGNGK